MINYDKSCEISHSSEVIVSKLMFWVLPVLCNCCSFHCQFTHKHKFKPYQGLVPIVDLWLQTGLTLCLIGILDGFCDGGI